VSRMPSTYCSYKKSNIRIIAVLSIAASLFLTSLALIQPSVSADTGTGAVSLTAIGTPATENFDTLSNVAGSTTNTTLPTGWYITETGGGARDNEQYAVDTGGSTTGDTYSYGAAAATDRALGGLQSGTLIPVFGAKFTNNTGVTVTSLDITYTGEEWRLGTAARTDQINFEISTNATDLSTGTYTGVAALNFVTPDTVTTGAKNGNAAGERTTLTATISSLSVPNGASFFIRWTDTNASGADDGLSVDDFSITPQVGPVTPTLNINDVTQAEGNAGTSTFTFNVTLTSPAGAGGVTFDIATADGTAQDGNPVGEDNDYVAKSETGRSISSGNSSATFTVSVNGDTMPEPNETFFVNVTNITGANAGDVQGLGTINNDDVTLIAIHTIQGSGSTSPLTGSVTTSGIVTGTKSNGFFIQEPDTSIDADPNTSEGIFVFTSSAPPVAATIGNSVQVTGTISDFIPTSDPTSPPLTELTSPTVVLLSSGNPLPAPILITAAETTQPSETTNPLDSLEEYEGMRVTVASLTVTGSTQGTITESSATVVSSGVFIGVVTGVARPFREPGIAISDPVPAPNPANVPRFDENPERIRVDSDAQPGTTALDVAAGTVVTNITGPLDFAFRTYTIDPDAATPPTVGAQPGSVPVPTPTADELTVASFNMERFFDTSDAPGISDPVLTLAAFNRRVAKASLIVRTVQKYPDVIGVQEVENLSTLQAVATQINNDAVAIDMLPNPNYQAYLVDGNDIGGIDVGFLIKESRVTRHTVTQLELPGCDHVTASTCNNYIDPNTGSLDILNDRPPLVLIASIPRTGGGLLGFTVIVNHLRSLNGVDDTTPAGTGTVGARVREKRRKQAEFLANYIQGRQTANPNEKIITVGDMNAFRVNDGYVDSIGTILGTPAPADQVVLPSADLITPNQTDLVDTLAALQQYSYNFDGNAQTLDHIIVNSPALAILSRFAYARNDSDFPVKNYETTNELRISDHDQPVAYFSLLAPTAANGSITGRITNSNGGPVSGAVVQVSGTQIRKSITDAYGNYHFDNVETNGFYTVTPARANYTFSPASRAFSLVGGRTEAAFTATVTGDATNPLEMAEYFVRQQYVDLLGREPDESGFNYWSDQINQCGNDVSCASGRRRDVAAAFFVEQEFQMTGSFIYGLYKGALGRRPVFREYAADRQLVVAGANLEARKQAFAEAFVRRDDFVSRYQSNLSAESFVDALIQSVRLSSGLDLGNQRDSLVSRYHLGANLEEARSLVLRELTESTPFRQAEYNPAFVLSEYFGYLQRDPDAPGYEFWVNVLNNQSAGNYRGMVCAFITSAEYQRRFSNVVSRNDGECSR